MNSDSIPKASSLGASRLISRRPHCSSTSWRNEPNPMASSASWFSMDWIRIRSSRWRRKSNLVFDLRYPLKAVTDRWLITGSPPGSGRSSNPVAPWIECHCHLRTTPSIVHQPFDPAGERFPVESKKQSAGDDGSPVDDRLAVTNLTVRPDWRIADNNQASRAVRRPGVNPRRSRAASGSQLSTEAAEGRIPSFKPVIIRSSESSRCASSQPTTATGDCDGETAELLLSEPTIIRRISLA